MQLQQRMLGDLNCGMRAKKIAVAKDAVKAKNVVKARIQRKHGMLWELTRLLVVAEQRDLLLCLKFPRQLSQLSLSSWLKDTQ